MTQRNVLLVDLPSYTVHMPLPYRHVLEYRLKAEAVLRERRLGTPLRRPSLTYSRGLLLVAATVEKHGHAVQYLVYPDPDDAAAFAEACKWADAIGFTAMTPVVQQAYRLCRSAKRINPRVLCVLGGPHATAQVGECLAECRDLDVVIPDEGESAFADLVDHLEAYQDVPGITYRSAGSEIKHNASSNSQKVRVSHLPPPAYHLLRRPLSAYGHNVRTYNGCPYLCDFCLERRSWRGQSGLNNVSRVVEEVRLVAQDAAPNTLIHFSDSVFTLDTNRTLELCHALSEARLGVVFSCDTRVDRIDPAVVKAMADAGFAVIRLGVEDLDNGILSAVHKGIVRSQSFRASEMIRDVAPSMVIHAYMLTGLPGSSRDSHLQSAHDIEHLIRTDVVDVIGNKMLVPYPGSPYFRTPKHYGFQILHNNWSKYDRMSVPVYRMQTLSEYEIYYDFLSLEAAQLRAYEEKIGHQMYRTDASPESLDYVFRNYVQQARH